MGINATIVMPETTPDIKVDAVRNFGGSYANVVLHGSNFDTAGAEARRLAEEEGLTPNRLRVSVNGCLAIV